MNTSGNKQIEANNLKVLKDPAWIWSFNEQKFNEYSGQCTDQSLKTLCTEASQVHKRNFDSLKSYLDSHQ